MLCMMKGKKKKKVFMLYKASNIGLSSSSHCMGFYFNKVHGLGLYPIHQMHPGGLPSMTERIVKAYSTMNK
jgi:hypothetical protein